MSRRIFYHSEPRYIRKILNNARESADQMKLAEQKLVEVLREVDNNRFYVWLGFKSLQGYCVHFLKLGRTRSQRIVTRVRRLDPTVKIEQ